MTRLDEAKAFYNREVKRRCNTEELGMGNTIFHIRSSVLYYILEEIFNDKPSVEEQDWFNSEMDEVVAYLNTECF